MVNPSLPGNRTTWTGRERQHAGEMPWGVCSFVVHLFNISNQMKAAVPHFCHPSNSSQAIKGTQKTGLGCSRFHFLNFAKNSQNVALCLIADLWLMYVIVCGSLPACGRSPCVWCYGDGEFIRARESGPVLTPGDNYMVIGVFMLTAFAGCLLSVSPGPRIKQVPHVLTAW